MLLEALPLWTWNVDDTWTDTCERLFAWISGELQGELPKGRSKAYTQEQQKLALWLKYQKQRLRSQKAADDLPDWQKKKLRRLGPGWKTFEKEVQKKRGKKR